MMAQLVANSPNVLRPTNKLVHRSRYQCQLVLVASYSYLDSYNYLASYIVRHLDYLLRRCIRYREISSYQLPISQLPIITISQLPIIPISKLRYLSLCLAYISYDILYFYFIAIHTIMSDTVWLADAAICVRMYSYIEVGN